MTRSDLVTVTKVEIEPPGPGLYGAHIDQPVAEETSGSYALEIRGWAVGVDQPVSSVEVTLGARNRMIAVVPSELRPDVADKYPDAPHASNCGFRVVVGVLENRANFALQLHAKLADGSRVRIGRLEGKRGPLSTGFQPEIQPLMLNTIGRSGSTWLAWLLSCHPEVIGYRPMEFETRVATYWTSVFQALAQPNSYLSQLVTTNLEGDPRWWLGDSAKRTPRSGDPELESWLGRDAVEQMAEMCQIRIEGFFKKIAASQGKEEATYFLEKFLLDPVVLELLSEVYSDAREIILVRDFRDVVSSVLAFNRKRGYQAFGREHVDSDEEYVRSVATKQALGVLQRWEEKGDDAHLIRYEDLLIEPQQTLELLFTFVGVDSSPSVVEETLNRAETEAPSMDHHRTARDPTATIGRWKDDLPEDLIDACGKHLDPMLGAFGYELTEPSSATRDT